MDAKFEIDGIHRRKSRRARYSHYWLAINRYICADVKSTILSLFSMAAVDVHISRFLEVTSAQKFLEPRKVEALGGLKTFFR
jgi:hypothetical protein